jgi:hypothetical protein
MVCASNTPTASTCARLNTTPIIVLRFEADNAGALSRIRTNSAACWSVPSPASRYPSDDARPAALADVEAARDRIASGIYVSPCVESIPLSNLTGAHVFASWIPAARRQLQRRGARARYALDRRTESVA